MRKKLLLLGSIVLSLMLFTGCSQGNPNHETNQEGVNEAITAAQEYKNIEYTVIDSEDILSEDAIQSRNEELQPFLTESFYTKAVDTRYTTLPLTIAEKQNRSLKPDNLKFSLVEDKQDIIELSYNVDLVLMEQGEKESKRVPLEGVLTLEDVNGEWLVQGDRYDSAAFNKLINE